MDRTETRDDQAADDFVMVDDPQVLPFRPPSAISEDSVTVELHPLDQKEAFIVSVRPPKMPKGGLKRASCDIVLVIDVSQSMQGAAPLPEAANEDERESTGFSVLDLTKHAAKTVLETLDEHDRLGIVIFSDFAQVVQNLTPMTPPDKRATWRRIDGLRTGSLTNLFSGILAGWSMLEQAGSVGNVQGLFILTDGMPNHLCPPQGYVAKLGPMLSAAAQVRACIPTIHTFGFGYYMSSGLMQSIAETGHGSYSFIPDAGMIGTVFVHSIATLFSTMATTASLDLMNSNGTILQATAGVSFQREGNYMTVNLGNLQYGQSRDLVVECPGIAADAIILAKLMYKLPNGTSHGFEARAQFSEKTELAPAIADYHISRAQICGYLSSLFPVKKNGEHTTVATDELGKARSGLDALISSIQALPTKSDPLVQSLLEDLVGEEPCGQISKALICTDEKPYWKKWGRHYLPSLLHAHQRQICNSFKDPGPLMYGKDSPLFIQCRAQLDDVFDHLEAPKPSRPERMTPVFNSSGVLTGTASRPHHSVSMSKYNSSSAPCFEGDSRITTADGSTIPIKTLTCGMSVWTPMGARRVAAVVRTSLRYQDGGQLCRVGRLLITAWHPLMHEGKWVFPQEIAEDSEAFQGDVYSVLLAPSRHEAAHAIEVGGQVCVTLGHGVIGREFDARSHPFFGHYRRAVMSLARLPIGTHGHLLCGGMRRDEITGLACDFMVPKARKNGSRGRLVRL